MIRMLQDLPAIMRAPEAAAYLDISARTLYRIIESGGIGYIRVSERCVRLRREHVAAFLASNTHEPAIAKAEG